MDLRERLALDGYEDCEPIFFYHPSDKYGWASNFSKHEIVLPSPFTFELTSYRTGEHRYQAMKATSVEDHDYIAGASNPTKAKSRGREILLRDAWGDSYGDLCYLVMLEVILTKVSQHNVIRRNLSKISTLQPIYEDSPTDDIWGIRCAQDYRGKNLLGRCWMQVRESL